MMMRIIPRRKVQFSLVELKAVYRWLLAEDRSTLVGKFEQGFAAYIGVKHACAVPSARTGLSLLLDCLDLKAGDEIILSSYNYHVVPFLLQSKGLKVVFVDIQPGRFNLDVDGIEEKITPKTKGIIATHLYGQACDIGKIQALCRKHCLLLVEDVAQALGAKVQGRRAGSFGDYAIYSFGTGKAMMTFAGGMVTSNHTANMEQLREKLAQQVQSGRVDQTVKHFIGAFLQTFFTNRIIFAVCVYPLLLLLELLKVDVMKGVTRESYSAQDVRLKGALTAFTSFQAEIGLVQLERIDAMNDRRRHNAHELTGYLSRCIGSPVRLVSAGPSNVVLYYPVWVEDVAAFRRYLLLQGIDTKISGMRNCAGLLGADGAYPQAEQVDGHIVELPCCPGVTEADITFMVEKIRAYFDPKGTG